MISYFIEKIGNILKNPKIMKQIRRYLITGFTSFGIEYISFGLLFSYILVKFQPVLYSYMYDIFHDISQLYFKTDLTPIAYRAIFANLIVYAVIFWVNFLMNRFWSFESKEPIVKQLILYGFLFVFNLSVGNVFLMYVFSNLLFVHPMISKVLIMGILVSWNFVIYKKVIYKN